MAETGRVEVPGKEAIFLQQKSSRPAAGPTKCASCFLMDLYTEVVERIAENLKRVREEIGTAARLAGRAPESVRLLAVSKTFPVRAIEAAARAGQIEFGESRVQEAEAKLPRIQATGLRWHLIGHLQSNKSRRAIDLFDVIESVDSQRLVRRLDRQSKELGKRLEVLLQVNIGGESQKFGIPPARFQFMVDLVDSLENLELLGLMAIPPYHRDPESSRPHFREMKRLFEEANQRRDTPLQELSMGMSHDFRVAIQEGSTLVRIGTAIFGEREA